MWEKINKTKYVLFYFFKITSSVSDSLLSISTSLIVRSFSFTMSSCFVIFFVFCYFISILQNYWVPYSTILSFMYPFAYLLYVLPIFSKSFFSCKSIFTCSTLFAVSYVPDAYQIGKTSNNNSFAFCRQLFELFKRGHLLTNA